MDWTYRQFNGMVILEQRFVDDGFGNLVRVFELRPNAVLFKDVMKDAVVVTLDRRNR